MAFAPRGLPNASEPGRLYSGRTISVYGTLPVLQSRLVLSTSSPYQTHYLTCPVCGRGRVPVQARIVHITKCLGCGAKLSHSMAGELTICEPGPLPKDTRWQWTNNPNIEELILRQSAKERREARQRVFPPSLERNASIFERWLQGEIIPDIAAWYGLRRNRVQDIIGRRLRREYESGNLVWRERDD